MPDWGNMKDKLILTDGDGVLLDWEWAFRAWMSERGYEFNQAGKISYALHQHYYDLAPDDVGKLCRIFNETAAIGFLGPVRDSVHYVRRLYEEHSYRFRVITSVSLDPRVKQLREMNLRQLYGNAIESVICLDVNADKTPELIRYRDSGLWWIEDKTENADVGHSLGLRSILIEHGHNMNHECPYPKVKNWSEIYQLITSDQSA